MPWKVVIAPRVAKDLDGLPRRDREAVERMIDRIHQGLGGLPLRKLRGREAEWRIPVGRWRIRLELDNAAGIIYVTRVLPRKDAYRD